MEEKNDNAMEMLEDMKACFQLAIACGATKEQLIENAEKSFNEGKIKGGDYQAILYCLGVKTELNKELFDMYN